MSPRSLSTSSLLLGTLLVSACGDHNLTGPPAGFKQILVTGPESIAPGATGRFTATGVLFSGKTEDLTRDVIWKAVSPSPYRTTLDPSPVLRFGSAAGEATGLMIGEATVQASYSGQGSTAITVFVQPAGTFRVAGIISDSPGQVQFATVEIVSGAGAGMATTTNYWGEFVFYGVSGTVVLQVSAAGYEPASRTITLTANRTENFALRPLSPPASLTGTWDLSIGLPSACRNLVPPDLQTRHQVATITQIGNFFDLSTPLMVVAKPPQVRGRILGKNFSLGLPPYDDEYDHDYWEESIGAAFFYLWGSLAGIADDDGVHGTFDGSVGYQPNPATAFLECKGTDGTFDLIRRSGG